MVSFNGESTNRLPASVSALTCHSPRGFASARNNNARPARQAIFRAMRTYRDLFRDAGVHAALPDLLRAGGRVRR